MTEQRITRYTLEEAAAMLERLVDESHKVAGHFTAAQVLHAGTDGRLLICVGLDMCCYSPTALARGATFEDASQSEAFGWFVVPARHLLTIESADEVKLQMVTSLDGLEIYFPFVTVTAASLRVLQHHLDCFVESLGAQTGERAVAEPVLKKKLQEEAIMRALCDLGYIPQSLPAPPPGKRSDVKAAVKATMLKNPRLFTESSFGKAWERLTSAGSLRYKRTS